MDARYAISRREEEKLMKEIKSEALKTCDGPVSTFAQCSSGRTVTVVWSCRHEFKAMNDCLAKQMTSERIDAAKVAYLKNRPAS